jgi:hypothetical protein
MAITNNGVMVTMPTNLLPSGYTVPTGNSFTDWTYKMQVTLNVLKATVENATKATTLTNIIEDATVGIEKQVTDIIAADYLASATVTTYVDLYDIKSNIETSIATDFYNDTAVSYVCSCYIYVKAA